MPGANEMTSGLGGRAHDRAQRRVVRAPRAQRQLAAPGERRASLLRSGRSADEGAAPDVAAHQTTRFELAVGVIRRRPADAQHGREVAFRRQPITRPQLAVRDRRGERLTELPV